MKAITFSYPDSLIFTDELAGAGNRLADEIQRMNRAAASGYRDDRASINLPLDQDALQAVKSLVAEKQKLKPRHLVVVGIGGSNLGTIAVQEAVRGRLYNQLNPPLKIYYSDTVDSVTMNSFLSILGPALEQGENVIINGVTKSGSTTETVANFEILVNLLQKYRDDYEKSVVVTTDRGSRAWNLAADLGFSRLEIPEKVGGRYSVLSPVGLFPLGLLGLDLDRLLAGAGLMRDLGLKEEFDRNPAALSAALIYLHRQKGRNIHDLFLFGSNLESLGKWYRQLMGESIGKEHNLKGEHVFAGITPTYSIGSTDLHSVAQLYLGGPYDKFTTFVSLKNSGPDVALPGLPEYSRLVEDLQGKTLNGIMEAIEKGVKIAYRNGKRPFVEIILPDPSESSIGQFLQLKMMEMMYLGALLEVNPFDQPNVESYKTETKKILAGEK